MGKRAHSYLKTTTTKRDMIHQALRQNSRLVLISVALKLMLYSVKIKNMEKKGKNKKSKKLNFMALL